MCVCVCTCMWGESYFYLDCLVWRHVHLNKLRKTQCSDSGDQEEDFGWWLSSWQGIGSEQSLLSRVDGIPTTTNKAGTSKTWHSQLGSDGICDSLEIQIQVSIYIYYPCIPSEPHLVMWRQEHNRPDTAIFRKVCLQGWPLAGGLESWHLHCSLTDKADGQCDFSCTPVFHPGIWHFGNCQAEDVYAMTTNKILRHWVFNGLPGQKHCTHSCIFHC